MIANPNGQGCTDCTYLVDRTKVCCYACVYTCELCTYIPTQCGMPGVEMEQLAMEDGEHVNQLTQ
jgi:hypothetical protein